MSGMSNYQEVEIPYLASSLVLNFPNQTEVTIIKPNDKVNAEEFNLDSRMGEILHETIWDELQQSTILIVVNDATRATPTELLLSKLVPFFDKMNIKTEFIIATGTHRKPNVSELQNIFGKFYETVKEHIYVHEAKDESKLVSIGVTSFNSEIKVNKQLFEEKYTAIVTINSIEPHYFAGWTGGRKSVVPGLAGYDSITKTHIHALSKESQNCRLDGNPVHDDLQEGFDFFLKRVNKKFYTFQFVLDSKGTIHELFAGDYSVFAKGVKYASKIFQVPVKDVFDMVIAVAYPPLDQDLYQSHKALENSKMAINKNNNGKKSYFILISPCKNGIGPDQFLKPFKDYAGMSYSESIHEITNNYKLGFHKAGKILEAEEYAYLYLYSELDNETGLKAHFKKVTENLDQFINQILQEEAIKKVAVIFDACVTVPILK